MLEFGMPTLIENKTIEDCISRLFIAEMVEKSKVLW